MYPSKGCSIRKLDKQEKAPLKQNYRSCHYLHISRMKETDVGELYNIRYSTLGQYFHFEMMGITLLFWPIDSNKPFCFYRKGINEYLNYKTCIIIRFS